jgi:hypothetical protein
MFTCVAQAGLAGIVAAPSGVKLENRQALASCMRLASEPPQYYDLSMKPPKPLKTGTGAIAVTKPKQNLHIRSVELRLLRST